MSVYNTIKPLLIFSKIFGLYPANIHQGHSMNSRGKYCLNIFNILWSIFVMLFLITYSACTIKFEDKPVTASELIIKIGDMIYMSISLINSFVISASSILNRKKFAELLQKLNNFDKKIKTLEAPCDLRNEYIRPKYYIVAAICSSVFLIFVYLIIDIILFIEEFTFSNMGAEVVAYVYPLTTMTIMILQFSSLALLIKQRFKRINLKLRQIQQNWRKNTMENTLIYSSRMVRSISPAINRNVLISEKTLSGLENLRRRHYELCCISENLNRIFNLPLLITALNLFISITFTLYFYFISNSEVKLNHPILYSLYYSVNGFINCSLLFGMIRAPSRTKTEAKFTAEILHSISNRTELLETYIMHFSLQLLQHNVKFSACRVFILDERMLVSIIGAITTYLVIVVQFQLQQT